MSDNLQLAVLTEIVAPDGTLYIVNEDGSWEQQSWDGHFVRDNSNASTTPEEVLAKLAEVGTASEAAKADGLLAEVVCPDGTQFSVYEDGSYVRECWDGSFVSDSTGGSTTPTDVLARFAA